MELHDTTHDAALVLVDQLAAHLPADLELGTPHTVTATEVLTGDGVLVTLETLDLGGRDVQVGSRTVRRRDGATEVTSWHRGREVEWRRAMIDSDD